MVFDSLFKDKGGISRDIFSEIPLTQNFLAYARAEIELLRAEEKSIPPIYVDLINNPALNAVTKRSGNQFFIGVYIGAILQSFVIFSRMLASNTILTDIGNATSESAPQKLYDIQLKDVLYPLSAFTRKLLPKDPVRNAVVKMFVKHILDFLIFHEYAHIVYGHLDYHNSILEQQGVSDNSLILQTLEVNADGFSTFISMLFLYGSPPDKNPIIPEELRPYYKDRKIALRMWLFSIYTYFRLFGHMNFRHSITTDNHPSPGCRANLIVEAIDTYKDCTFGNIDGEILPELCIDTLMEVEEAFAQISEQGLDQRPLRSSFSEEAIRHTRDLFAKELEIFDLLREYSYIPQNSRDY